jgi:hypothetical protein
MCLLRGMNRICKFNSGKFYVQTAVPWLRQLVAVDSLNPWEVYGEKAKFYSFFRVLRYGPDSVIPPAFYTQLYLHFAPASRTNERSLGNFQISEIGENLIESTSTVSPVKG